MKTGPVRFAAATAAFLVAIAVAAAVAQGGAAAGEPACDTRRDALRLLAARSLKGDAEATFELARRVEEGIGTEPDPGEAAYWYGIAEEQGRTLPEDVVTRLFP